jgi:hypothetical protein
MQSEENIHLLTSRFNNDTWRENETYRERLKLDGCVYGCPLRISKKIHTYAPAYVIEMNNNTNKIEGIGVIRNYPNFKEPAWVYNDNNYNRFIYSGRYRLSREMLVRYNENIIDIIEQICFRGKTHLKRGSGITSVPVKLIKEAEKKGQLKGAHIRIELRNIFRTHFQLNENE